MKTWPILTLIILGIQLVGCLEMDIEETVFLEPDGSGTYQVQVRVYEEPGETTIEEQMEDHLTGEESIGEEMAKIGAEDVRVILIRDRYPLEYVVQGKFTSINTILEVIFENRPAIRWDDVHTEEGRSLIFRLDETGDPDWELSEEIEFVAVGGWIEKGPSPMMLGDTDPATELHSGELDEHESRIRPVRWSDWRGLSFHWKGDQME